MANKYDKLFEGIDMPGGPQPTSNKYDDLMKNIDKVDIAGYGRERVFGEHGLAKQDELARKSAELEAEAKKQASIGTAIKEGLKGIVGMSEAKPYRRIAKTVATEPVATATGIAGGALESLTVGGSDWVVNKVIDKQDEWGLSQETVDNLNYFLNPITGNKERDADIEAIRKGTGAATFLAPYMAIDTVLANGLKYAAPEFAAKHYRVASGLRDAVGFGVLGQVEESFKDPGERNRVARLGLDVGLGFLGGAAFGKAPVGGKLSKAQTILGGDKGYFPSAQNLTKDGTMLPTLRKITNTIWGKGRANIEPGINNIIDEGGNKILQDNVIIVGKDAAGNEIRIATKDADALQNYIKGSNDITYKKMPSSMFDEQGREIAARFEMGANGKATIFVGKNTPAESIAHELGHFFNYKATGSVSRLTDMLQYPTKNIGELTDALGEFALKNLGGEATGAQISKEIENIAKTIKREAAELAAERGASRGVARTTESISENFADAVALILTKGGASQKAPMLTALLKHIDDAGNKDFLKDNIVKAMKSIKSEPVAKTVIPKIQKAEKDIANRAAAINKLEKEKAILGQKMVNEKKVLKSAKTATQKTKSKIVIENLKTKREEITANVRILKTNAKEQAKVVKENIAKEKTYSKGTGTGGDGKTKQLNRGATGKQPKTAPIRAEKITSNEAQEVFINTKILPKMTGKHRIGRSNDDIRKQAMASKFTENDFDNILKERFGGNIPAEIMKGKQILVDSVSKLQEKLGGRNIESLTGKEKAEVLADYNRIVEQFEVFAAVRTELSNSFRTLGIQANPGENDMMEGALTMIQKAMGEEANPIVLAQKLTKLTESNIFDKYIKIWYPSILSGPKTHARNILGGASNLLFQTLSTGFTKQGINEFASRVAAIRGEHKNAWQLAKKIFSEGRDIKGDSKFFHDNPALISIAEQGAQIKDKNAYRIFLEKVGNALEAQDMYFNSLAKAGEKAAVEKSAVKFGVNEAAEKQISDAFIAEIGKRTTFRNTLDKSAIGSLGSLLSGVKTSENPYLRAASTFIIPFVKTVANITDRRMDFIPLLNLARTFDSLGAQRIYGDIANKIIKNSGATLSQTEREAAKQVIMKRLRDQQIGRFAMGMSALTAGTPLAMSGMISGTGPKNKAERDTLMATGWRPNSFILPNGVAVPYQNLALPLASIFSILGNMNDAIQYKDGDKNYSELALRGMINYMRSETDQSFLSGISNIFDMMSEYTTPEQGVNTLLTNMLPIPGLLTQTKDIVMPERKMTKGLWQTLRNKVGVTLGLEPRLDAFGRPVKADLIYGLTPAFTTGLPTGIERNYITSDPVLNFMKEKDVFVGKPQIATKIKGKKEGEFRTMTQKEYRQYVEESGDKIYNIIKRKVESGAWDRKTQAEIKSEMASITRDIREREKRKIKF